MWSVEKHKTKKQFKVIWNIGIFMLGLQALNRTIFEMKFLFFLNKL